LNMVIHASLRNAYPGTLPFLYLEALLVKNSCLE
jgi:hypothetical protein